MIFSLLGKVFRQQSSYKTFSKEPAEHEKLIPVHCPICFANTAQPYWDCGRYVFSRCIRCGHVYQNPMPASDYLLERYDAEYKEYEVENSENFFTLMRYGLRDAAFFSLERGLSGGKHALDIGCATGVLVKYLCGRGWNAEGLEVCRPAAEYGMKHRGVHIHVDTLEAAKLGSERYDLVHFSHVIEHLPDINAFLEEVRRITRIGGHIIMTTPNRNSLQAAVMGKQWRSAIADHTHVFSVKELITLVDRHGFSLLRWKSWGGIPVGMAHPLVKKHVDRLARLLGIGDVVMLMARRVS